jgi:hypothetical protein
MRAVSWLQPKGERFDSHPRLRAKRPGTSGAADRGEEQFFPGSTSDLSFVVEESRSAVYCPQGSVETCKQVESGCLEGAQVCVCSC